MLLSRLLLFAGVTMTAGAAEITLEQAGSFAKLALDCVHKEYPNKIAHAMNSDADVKPPRELTPAFYGCYDWHSSVHGHWLLARLARQFPNASFAQPARASLARDLTPVNIAGEVKYLAGEGRNTFERPYGLAWVLQLASELQQWDDPQVREWASAIRPLEDAVVARVSAWLPKLAGPIRTGEHNNTAFGMSMMLDYARSAGNPEFAALLEKRARDFYSKDRACPLTYEPSGEDFLSPCLAEADLMRRVMGQAEFAAWFGAFLPKLDMSPTRVTDVTDGKAYHLAGLNLSRAWMLRGIAGRLPDGKRLIELADRLRRVGLESISAAHYEGGHWLGTFAVYP